MYPNSTLKVAPPNASKTPVFFCPKEPDFTWNLDYTTLAWILATILLLTTPFIILLNASVIIAVRTRKDLQRQSNIVISSMAIADLLVGAVSMPISAVVDLLIIHQVFLEHVCTLNTVNIAIMECFLFSSIFHLVVIAWERYTAIRKWIDYRVTVTRKRLKNLAAFAWVGAVFLATSLAVMLGLGVDFTFQKIWYIIATVLLGFSVTLIVYFYIMVFLGVRQRGTSNISQVTVLVQAKLESKVAKTTALLTAAMIGTLIFGGVLSALGGSFPVFRENAAFRIAETLLLLNSMINPLIYCYRDRRFRKAVLELLRIRKPAETHRTAGAAPAGRGKEQFESYPVEGVHSQLQDVGKRLKRSSFCDRSANHYRFHSEVVQVKRSMSAPSLSIVHDDDVHLDQPTSVLTIHNIIHSEMAEDNLPPPEMPPHVDERTSRRLNEHF